MMTDDFRTRVFCDQQSTHIRALVLFVVAFSVFAVLAKLVFTKLITEGVISENSSHEVSIYGIGFIYLMMMIIGIFWRPKITLDRQEMRVTGEPTLFFMVSKKQWVDMSGKDMRKLTRRGRPRPDLIEIKRVRPGQKTKSSIAHEAYVDLIRAYRENALKNTSNETGLRS